MFTTKRAAFAALALTATLGLTACNDSDAPGANSSSSTTGNSSSSSNAGASESSSSNESSPTSSAESSSEAADTQAQPASEREDKNDKSAMDAEFAKLPAGPMTNAKILKLGGYRTVGGDHGDFYAVLSVDASETGLVDLEYVLLDGSGKEVGTVKDGFSVRKGENILKVTRGAGEVPASAKKVRLKVTKNQANSYATESEIDPVMKFALDPDTKTAVVTGRYKTVGKGSLTSLTGVCSDAQGVVQAATSPITKIRATEWTPYKIKFLMAPKGWTPTKCYVGA